MEKGWATGVLTKGGFFRAPVVVSDAGIQPTVLKLVGEEHFDRSYVAYVKGLPPSLGFARVRYILREPVRYPMHCIRYGLMIAGGTSRSISESRLAVFPRTSR